MPIGLAAKVGAMWRRYTDVCRSRDDCRHGCDAIHASANSPRVTRLARGPIHRPSTRPAVSVASQRMSREPLPEERFAVEVLHRVIDAEVTQWDDGSSSAMVDALFKLPDGRLGALEVTTLGVAGDLQAESMGADLSGMTVPDAEWTWTLYVTSKVRMKDAEALIASLVRTCEQQGVRSPDRLPLREHRHDPAYRWWRAAGCPMMFAVPDTTCPGVVDILPDIGGGGAVPSHADGLLPWVDEVLASALVQNKLDKLRRTGRPEQHLFLRIHESGVPGFDFQYVLSFTTLVPSMPLNAPPNLTGLWLAPRWDCPILSWRADVGWRREDCLG